MRETACFACRTGDMPPASFSLLKRTVCARQVRTALWSEARRASRAVRKGAGGFLRKRNRRAGVAEKRYALYP